MRGHNLADMLWRIEGILADPCAAYHFEHVDTLAVTAGLAQGAVSFSFDVWPTIHHVRFGVDLARDDRLRLPFPIVLFSYPRSAKSAHFTLAFHADDEGAIGVYTFLSTRDHLDGASAQMFVPAWSMTIRPGELSCGPTFFSRATREKVGMSDDVLIREVHWDLDVVYGFVSMLSSRDVEVRDLPPPSRRLNADRVAKGRSPIGESKVVKIRPHARPAYGLEPHGGAEARYVRMHWRRGHYRTLRAERFGGTRVVPVSPCVVGAADGAVLPAPKEYVVEAGR